MPPKRNTNTSSNHNLNSNVLINAIAPFSGDPFELTFFFDSLNDVKILNNISEPEVIALLRQKLTGEAKRFYIQEPSFKNATTLESIKQIFQNYFRVAKNPDQEWTSFRMNDGETYVQLAHRLNIVASETFPDMDEVTLQQVKLVKLKGVVPLLMKEKLLKKNFQKFEDAITYCQKYQDVALSLNNITTVDSLKTTVATCVTQDVNNIQPEVVPQNTSSNSNSKPNYSRRRGNSNNNSGNRFHNNNNQNLRNANYRGRSNFRGNRVFKSNGRQNSGPVQCQFCAKRGHVLQNCFQFTNFLNTRNSNQNMPPQNFPTFPFNMPPPFSFPMLPNFPNQMHNTNTQSNTQTDLNSQTGP